MVSLDLTTEIKYCLVFFMALRRLFILAKFRHIGGLQGHGDASLRCPSNGSILTRHAASSNWMSRHMKESGEVPLSLSHIHMADNVR